MDSEKNWEILLEILYKIVPPILPVIALVFIYLFYDEAVFMSIIKFLSPITIFLLGLYFCFIYRRKKNKILKQENGTTEVIITIRYFKFFLHDTLIFLIPSAIIITSFWLNNEVQKTDIINSIIAFFGLYASTLIYKRTNI